MRTTAKISYTIFFMILIFSANTSFAKRALQKTETQKKQAKQPHHFFNAELLAPNEKQVNITANVKFGVTENLELGTQGLLILAGAYNLYLKHRMFEGEKWKTAFVNHSLILQSTSNEVDPDTLNETKNSTRLFMSIFGVLTTHKWDRRTSVSWGAYDLYVSSKQSVDHLEFQAHLISPTAAIDYKLNKNWFLTGTLAHTIYMTANIESDFGDANLDAALLGSEQLNIDTTLAFATATYHKDSFNVEFGLTRLPGLFLPYINLFWRLM